MDILTVCQHSARFFLDMILGIAAGVVSLYFVDVWLERREKANPPRLRLLWLTAISLPTVLVGALAVNGTMFWVSLAFAMGIPLFFTLSSVLPACRRLLDRIRRPGFDILCGGFPCQPFSLAGDQDRVSRGK